MSSFADGDLDGVADHGDLDLAAPELVAGPIGGGGEAHVAGAVDLAGDRRRRGGRPGRRRRLAACGPCPAVCLSTGCGGGRGWR